MSNFYKRNTSTLLTCIGAGGVILSSVLAARATPKALNRLEQAEKTKGEPLTKFEKVKAVSPAYIPAAVCCLSTIGCIFGANVLNQRNQAAITSAYMLLDSSYKKYRAKVKELYGEDGDHKVVEAIAHDEIDPDISIEDESRLFWDVASMRYFEATSEQLRNAEYDLNKKLITTGYACLNDFYELLGIPKVDYGDKMGWSTYSYGRYYDGCNQIEFHHHPTTVDDGLECCMVYFLTEPSLDHDIY